MSRDSDPIVREGVPARVRRLARPGAIREYGIVLSFVALFLVLTFSSDAFFTQRNILSILNQQAPTLIIAAAGTLVIIAGGFDISVGAVYALAGVVGTKVALEVNPYVGMAVGIAIGLGTGLLNGAVATVGRINSLIATLASSFVFRGIAIVITTGSVFLIDDMRYAGLGQNNVFGVKIAIWIAALWVGALWFVLTRTVFGRFVFASGDNPEAARLAGVRVNVVRTATFALSGLAASLAGVIASSRFQSGQADVGTGLEFTVIAGIVVGGTSILGGEGAIWRTVLGVLFIALIGNGFTLLEVDPIYQQIVQGGIIIVAVAVDAWSRSRRA
jgi:ribose transport system permease protein